MAIVDMVLSGSKNAEVKKTHQEIVKENLETSGFKYIQTPMSVVVEGELDDIMAMVKKIQGRNCRCRIRTCVFDLAY